ncbi:MAG: hypothetical protein HY767_01455, partial [Candidatus Omnitrophica bacterium]|nr:hypothetical protein [Candidatus Omnitrophota bacterium]
MRLRHTKGRSISVRVISLLVAWIFLCSSLPFSLPQAFAQASDSSNVREGTDTSLLASASAFSGNVQELIVPPGLGSVQESFRGNSTPSQSPVILIQDAHAVPDAQLSLEKLVEYFQDKYDIKTVALEGAEGKLDATLFRSFPDAKKRADAFGEYLGSGELSGAAVASVLSPHKAQYVGIEDGDLYQEGVAAFLDGLKKQSALNAQSATLRKKLQRLKTKYYSKEALEFEEKFMAWNERPENLPGFLNYLLNAKGERSDVLARYPAIRTVMQGLQNENIPEGSELDQEIKGLL